MQNIPSCCYVEKWMNKIGKLGGLPNPQPKWLYSHPPPPAPTSPPPASSSHTLGWHNVGPTHVGGRALEQHTLFFNLPKLTVKFVHRGHHLVVENNIMGIQVKSIKSRAIEDVGESTRLDIQMDFSEIHIFREACISVLEIVKLTVVSSTYIPLQTNCKLSEAAFSDYGLMADGIFSGITRAMACFFYELDNSIKGGDTGLGWWCSEGLPLARV
ncbi:hypothetical protein U1Q18_016506 [Sarracenia purpurea var. burkii]